MSLVFTPNLLDSLTNANIAIDTCTIIDSSKCEELQDLLSKLREKNCVFLTLPSVKDEFTCSAQNKKDYDKLSEYFESLDIILMPKSEEKLLTNDGVNFNIAICRSNIKNPSYVDRSLLFISYLYRDSSEKVYIMTSNYKDVPREFFDLIGMITYDKNGFHNIGIYEFNANNYNAIISDI